MAKIIKFQFVRCNTFVNRANEERSELAGDCILCDSAGVKNAIRAGRNPAQEGGYDPEKGWSPATVNRLEQLTDSILERLEDPQRLGNWSRRGMVVGQVQSDVFSTGNGRSKKCSFLAKK